jgi:hydrogenase-1 operon protein HyaF
MDLRQIPIRVIGPGSQADGEDGQTISYIDMPSDMSMYRPPTMPEPDAVADLSGAREAMQWLQVALKNSADNCAPQLADLTALDDKNRDLVNQILGEGEVSINYAGEIRARTQEAVIAGVWRTAYFDAEDRTMIDLLEVADAPHVVRLSGATLHEINTQPDNVPDGVMNALPILVELESHCSAYETSQTPHAINLTLLPLSDADLIFLDEQLGRGPVDTLSRAYGKCQVISTLVPNVWWVRFYNSMGILILNTLEVVDVPAVVRAAPEDLQDSAERLEDLLQFCWSDAT